MTRGTRRGGEAAADQHIAARAHGHRVCTILALPAAVWFESVALESKDGCRIVLLSFAPICGSGLGWLGELKFSVFFRVIARCARRVR